MNEHPSRIEPCHIETIPTDLADLVVRLTRSSQALQRYLHPKTAESLASLVRIMNCYYSNLIEGHDTLPLDIERALRNDYYADERRSLQVEANAHIRLQKEIDEKFLKGKLGNPCSLAFVQWLHERFYDGVNPSQLRIKTSAREIQMTPGVFRLSAEENVSVGRHLPPESRHVAEFMHYFQERFDDRYRGESQRILALASAHHRLNFIHPFMDGNGRVSRLMTHAMGLAAGIGAQGLWSVSRGLARGLASPLEYKQMMDLADTPRQGDLDGRGNLSLKSLGEFTTWFLRICIDQTEFMGSLFQLDTLNQRLSGLTSAYGWPSQAAVLLREVLHRGSIDRGSVPSIVGMKERSARDLLSKLVGHGILRSETPKGQVSLYFQIGDASLLFPKLYVPT
jgi:Fic family protein